MDTDQILSITSITVVCTCGIGCIFYAFYATRRREIRNEEVYEPMVNLV
jgi:hypothetical protein